MDKQLLRRIPKVDDLLRRPALEALAVEAPASAVTEAVRRTLDALRENILSGAVTDLPCEETLCAEIAEACRSARLPSLRSVINATGVVLTKLDGTPRGGCAVSVWENLGLPIRFIGVGEKIDDLMEFDAQTFVESLLPESALQKDGEKEEGESEA